MRIRHRPLPPGFTLTDLAALLAVLTLLGILTRPLWGDAAPPRSLICLDNHRRLISGWLEYTSDNQGRLVANDHGGALQVGSTRTNWVLGWLDWTTNPANTNTTLLVDPSQAALAPYIGRDPSVFKCPGDGYVSSAQVTRGWSARTRSYSMNGNVGPGNAKDLFGFGYAVYETLGDFRRLPPSRAFVFLAEHPDSVNDPCFFVNLSAPRWVDLPAAFHEGAEWFSFADGHVEQRRWQAASTLVPVKMGSFSPPVASTGNPDYAWMKERASEIR
jgi:hypothetical protein